MITLRSQTNADDDFLYNLYCSTRDEELKKMRCDASQLEIFLNFQFNAQKVHYKHRYSNAKFDIILVNKRMAGRLYLSCDNQELRIVDISLLPEFRRQGYGTEILTMVTERARRNKLPVRLSVVLGNPAINLYKRLGFIVIAENPPYIELEKNLNIKII